MRDLDRILGGAWGLGLIGIGLSYGPSQSWWYFLVLSGALLAARLLTAEDEDLTILLGLTPILGVIPMLGAPSP